jgi:predicted GIY-YIG superfamily endonuclease
MPAPSREVLGMPHTLYRAFAVDGSLIYIGITHNLRARVANHKSASWWWRSEVHRVTAEGHSALRAEVQAIHSECPARNVQHAIAV